MDSVAKSFNRLGKRYENVLEGNPIYTEGLDITLPLNGSEVSVEKTKKPRCLQRAKRIDQSMRFEEEDEEITKSPGQKEGLKPRKVVRFKLENNKILGPNKPAKFASDQEPKSKEKTLEEKESLNIVKEKEEEVVRVKIKMTKHEAQRLLSNCKNDSVLDIDHVVDKISQVPVHQLQVTVMVVACK